ncbi:unnamed protein product [Sphagnum balticum]
MQLRPRHVPGVPGDALPQAHRASTTLHGADGQAVGADVSLRRTQSTEIGRIHGHAAAEYTIRHWVRREHGLCTRAPTLAETIPSRTYLVQTCLTSASGDRVSSTICRCVQCELQDERHGVRHIGTVELVTVRRVANTALLRAGHLVGHTDSMS